VAAERGIPLRELVTRMLAENLPPRANERKPWMKSFGKLETLRRETARISQAIESEFEQIEPEDRK